MRILVTSIMTEIEKSLPKKLETDEEGFRISTPVEIAEYKAKRLKNKSIADLGCGIGIQSIYFSKFFEEVISVELNSERYRIAKRNFKKMHIKNIEILNGDAFDKEIINKLDHVDVIFSDPSRPKIGEEWTFQDLSPSPEKIVESYKNHESFSFDVPVHMKISNINEDWEKEFISVRGEIKRLSLYTGELKRHDLSALLLPLEIRLSKNKEIDRSLPLDESLGEYIYEIDPAIWYADLLPELFHEFKDMHLIFKDKKRVFSTGNLNYVDDRFKNIYMKIFTAEDTQDLKNKLLLNGAGKVFLRYRIESDYYTIKSSIEKNLKGKETFFIFKFNDKFVGATKV